MSDEALAKVFLEAWQGSGDLGNLESVLRALCASVRGRWPEIALNAPAFVRHLGERLPASAGPGALEQLHADDIGLAFACVAGDAAALAIFEKHFLGQVPAFVGRLMRTPEGIEDVRQELREKLLVSAPGTLPKLADYSGEGALGSWVRVAATRLALNLLRSGKRRGEREQASDPAPTPIPDPELDYIKTRYRGEFAEAFRGALSAVEQRERSLLRMHFLERVGIGQLATIYGVHRTTMARWIADAQHAVLEETRRRMCERLGVNRAECDSLVAVVRSRFSLTLHSLFTRDPEEPE